MENRKSNRYKWRVLTRRVNVGIREKRFAIGGCLVVVIFFSALLSAVGRRKKFSFVNGSTVLKSRVVNILNLKAADKSRRTRKKRLSNHSKAQFIVIKIVLNKNRSLLRLIRPDESGGSFFKMRVIARAFRRLQRTLDISTWRYY